MEGFCKEAKGQGSPGTQDTSEAEQGEMEECPRLQTRRDDTPAPKREHSHSACCRTNEALAILPA